MMWTHVVAAIGRATRRQVAQQVVKGEARLEIVQLRYGSEVHRIHRPQVISGSRQQDAAFGAARPPRRCVAGVQLLHGTLLLRAAIGAGATAAARAAAALRRGLHALWRRHKKEIAHNPGLLQIRRCKALAFCKAMAAAACDFPFRFGGHGSWPVFQLQVYSNLENCRRLQLVDAVQDSAGSHQDARRSSHEAVGLHLAFERRHRCRVGLITEPGARPCRIERGLHRLQHVPECEVNVGADQVTSCAGPYWSPAGTKPPCLFG